jgi:hypothetical protein
MVSRSLLMKLCATAYLGVIGVSVVDLMRDPPSKAYVIAPEDDWTRCVEIRATSERMALKEALRRPIPPRTANDCLVLPATKAMDSRLVLGRSVNAALIVSAILAALWGASVALRAWRRGDDPFD